MTNLQQEVEQLNQYHQTNQDAAFDALFMPLCMKAAQAGCELFYHHGMYAVRERAGIPDAPPDWIESVLQEASE